MQSINHLIEQIQEDTRNTADFTGIETISESVLELVQSLPRASFVSSDLVGESNENYPLPIGYGQTVSQPFMVALMSSLLELTKDMNVLEVGTGSGYQTAILASLAKHVVSLEIIPELAKKAEKTLSELDVNNVELHIQNGHHGFTEKAPYDRIIVTACAKVLPVALINQLRPTGKLIMPLGLHSHNQTLVLISKDQNGMVYSKNILPVCFVPMIGA